MNEENADKLKDFAKETSEPFYSQEKVEALISATVDAAESLGLNILEVHGACSALKSCCACAAVAWAGAVAAVAAGGAASRLQAPSASARAMAVARVRRIGRLHMAIARL